MKFLRPFTRRFATLACLAALFLIPGSPLLADMGDAMDTAAGPWQYIATKHYDLVFPRSLEPEAQRLANTLEYLFELQDDTLKPTRHFRYPIILSTDVLLPNGYVTIAGRHSRYYATPLGDFTGDFLTTLAVHEGRHMTQFDALDRNLRAVLGVAVGELALAPSLPSWFYEGDAVMAETLLTQTGRGRDPAFTVQAKALLLEGKSFEYNKMLLGSYRDTIPNAYPFGYLMYSWLRSKYRSDAPEEIFRLSSWLPLPVLGSEVAIHKLSGKHLQEIWEELSAELIRFWKNQVAALDITPVEPWLKKRPDDRLWYPSICLGGDGSVYANQSRPGEGPQMVQLKPGAKAPLVLTTAMALNQLSQGGQLLAWDEAVGIAHRDKVKSRISLYDLKSRQIRYLEGSGRWLSPALSPDGSKLAVVEWLANYRGRLLLLDSRDGRQLAEQAIPEGEYWSELSFTGDGASLVALATGARGKAVIRIDAALARPASFLIPFEYANLRSPRLQGDTLYLNADWSGIETIWAVKPDGSRWELVERPLAARQPQPAADGKRLVFSDYADSRGEQIVSIPLDPANWKPQAAVKVQREDFFAPVLASEPGAGTLTPEAIPQEVYEVKDWIPELNGNRLSVWQPLVGLDPDTLLPDAFGLSGLITNPMGLSQQTISATYTISQKRIGLDYHLLFNGWFPQIDLGLGIGLSDPAASPLWDGNAGLGLTLPFGESSVGGFSWYLKPGSSVSVGATLDSAGTLELPVLPIRHSLALGLGLGRFWLDTQAVYQWSPLLEAGTDRWKAALSLGVPGFFPADAFRLTGQLEIANGAASPGQRGPHGYRSPAADDAVLGGLSWALPLVHPDIAFGPVWYWQTIAIEPFGEAEWLLADGRFRASAGLALYLRGSFFQLPLPLDLGLRASWRFEDMKPAFDFILSDLEIPIE